MRWSNVWTIFRREVRDQLRDRRTLFMILVMPILLYPILGIGMAQVANTFGNRQRVVILLGAENLPKDPPLLNATKTGFRAELFDPATEEEARKLTVKVEPAGSFWADDAKRAEALRGGLAEAVVIVPRDLREQLRREAAIRLPIAYNSADEKSLVGSARVRDVLDRWRDAIVLKRLKQDKKPVGYVEPVRIERVDAARKEEVGSNVWARIFPFLLVMMALTGAFYPAIDLCAGEKERGTMETLLISPASRVEIVIGKFFTIMLASIATALLNIASLGLTGWQLARQFPGLDGGRPSGGGGFGAGLAAPSLASASWMILLLIPLAMFFSALCLALAVLARSMKEGQYYMTPLYLVALPLMFLTLAPGIELDLFTSLVPITGVSLLLRTLMQGKYDVAARYSLPVLLPTIVYGVLALRWAVDQFQSETVLFRDAERFDLRDYLRHLVRDRGPRPGPGQAILCFAIMIVSAWFVAPSLGTSIWALPLGHLAYILGPPVLMAFLLTSEPWKTLRLVRPRASDLATAFVLALALNPLATELRPWVEWLFPISEAVTRALGSILIDLPLGVAVLLLAVVPAISEEVAFRGFILSGLRTRYGVWASIAISALLFGFLHVLLSLFQQLFNATLLGLVLGLLAVKTRSLWPGVVFHATSNAAAILLDDLGKRPGFAGIARALYRDPQSAQYRYGWVLLGAAVSAGLIAALIRRPEAKGAMGGEP